MSHNTAVAAGATVPMYRLARTPPLARRFSVVACGGTDPLVVDPADQS